jgi:hypothetical protein
VIGVSVGGLSAWARGLGLRAGAWIGRLESNSTLNNSLAGRVVAASRAQYDASLLQRRQTDRLRTVLEAAAGASAHADVAGLLLERCHAGTDSVAELLAGIPIMTKDQVRHGLRNYLVPTPGPVDVRVTSGTSGDVTQVARPRAATVERAAVDRRLFDSLGLPPFFTLALVVPWEQEPVDSWGLIDWRIRLRQVGLDQLVGGPGTAATPADLLMTSPATCSILADRHPAGCHIVSAWEVTRPVRALLGAVAPGPPESTAEMYVAAEMTAPIAVRYPDCPSMHVNSDVVHVEIVNPHTGEPVGAGTPGLLVLTDLLNTSMPFLRYRIGDVGLVEEGRRCSCGRFTPVLTLLGRGGGRMAETRDLAARLPRRHRWVLVEQDDGTPVLLTDGVVDGDINERIPQVRPLPRALRAVLPGGLVVSLRERYPLRDWRGRSAWELRAGARSPHAAMLARRRGGPVPVERA